MRVTNVEKSKRRIGLSMLPWKEQTEEEKARGKRGGGGRFSDVGFGEADMEWRLKPEEIEAMTVGDAFASPFEAAFERAKLVTESKQTKKNYAKQVL